VRPQLARSAVKVAFIVELWRPQVPAVADYLRQLRGFDHVFMFNRWAMDDVAALSGAPVSYLATAVDTDRFAPRHPSPPPRVIDVASYGRRLPGTHAALRRAAAERGLYYHYDTVRGAFAVTDHVEHRDALAATLQRSRYAVVYRNNDEPERRARTGGEESLTNRYFEVLAAGATMLGSAAQTPDFEACFDWPDAIVPIAAPDPGVADVVAELDADAERVERARRTAVAESLRRHDWAHRWQDVLDAVGLAPRPQLGDRLARLAERAAVVEGVPGERGTVTSGTPTTGLGPGGPEPAGA